MMIAISQYRDYVRLEGKYPRKELLEQLGYKSADKMYRDDKDGNAKHVGYVVGGVWYALYTLTEWVGAA